MALASEAIRTKNAEHDDAPAPGQPQRRPRRTSGRHHGVFTFLVRAFDRTPVRRSIRTGVRKSSTSGRHAAAKVVQMFEYVAPRRYGLASEGVSRDKRPSPRRGSGSATHHVPTRHWPTGRADVSTDDRTSRQHQQNSKPEAANTAAAMRRRTPSRARSADAPQLRAVTPVVSHFPDLVTADLTARQRRILEFIRDWVERYGYPPSVREIGEAVGLVSPSSVAYQLKALETKGFLRRDPNRPRAVDVRSPSELVDDETLRSARPDPGVRAAGRPDRRRWPDPGRAGGGGLLPAAARAGRRGRRLHARGQGRLDDRRGDLQRRLGGRPPAADGQRRATSWPR